MNHWLLVGATGRVGRMVARAWEIAPPHGATVVCQGRQAGAGLVWAPLEGSGALQDSVARRGGFDTMIVLAGTTPATGSDMEVNSALAVACVQGARDAGFRRVLVASSSAVYGPGEGVPLTEDAPLAPVNAYGASKMRMEIALRPFAEQGIEVCSLRIGNVAGADALLLNALRAGADQPIIVDQFADGRGPLRSYIGPVSLARVLATLARHEGALPACLNIAAGPVGMADLARASGRPWAFRPAVAGALQTLVLDTRRLNALHGAGTEPADAPTLVAQCRETGLTL